jgi:hypothetical protein
MACTIGNLGAAGGTGLHRIGGSLGALVVESGQALGISSWIADGETEAAHR